MDKKSYWIKLHAYISSDGMIDKWKSKDMHGKRLRIRPKFRIRFYNQNKILIDDFIESVKIICPHLKYIHHIEKRNEVVIRSQVFAKGLLELGDVSTPHWEIPKKLSKSQKIIWIRAFADCDGTMGYYKYNRYIAIDSINLSGLKQLSRIISELGCSNRIQKVKYRGKISYRLKISGRGNLIKYFKLIGFTHPQKQARLLKALKSYK